MRMWFPQIPSIPAILSEGAVSLDVEAIIPTFRKGTPGLCLIAVNAGFQPIQKADRTMTYHHLRSAPQNDDNTGYKDWSFPAP